MSNNEPIPADVWDAARSEIDRSRGYEAIAVVARAIMKERDRCEKIAMGASRVGNDPISMTIANAIRKGTP